MHARDRCIRPRRPPSEADRRDHHPVRRPSPAHQLLHRNRSTHKHRRSTCSRSGSPGRNDIGCDSGPRCTHRPHNPRRARNSDPCSHRSTRPRDTRFQVHTPRRTRWCSARNGRLAHPHTGHHRCTRSRSRAGTPRTPTRCARSSSPLGSRAIGCTRCGSAGEHTRGAQRTDHCANIRRPLPRARRHTPKAKRARSSARGFLPRLGYATQLRALRRPAPPRGEP